MRGASEPREFKALAYIRVLHLSLLNLLTLRPERALVLLPGLREVRLDIGHDGRVLRMCVRLRLVPQHRVDRLPPLLALREVDQGDRGPERRRRGLDQHVVRVLLVRDLQVCEVHPDVRDAGPVGGTLQEAICREVARLLVVLRQLLELNPTPDVRPGEVQAADDRARERVDQRVHGGVVVQCLAFL